MIIEEFKGGFFDNCTAPRGQLFECPFGTGIIPKSVVIDSFEYDINHLLRNSLILVAYITLFIASGHFMMKMNSRK